MKETSVTPFSTPTQRATVAANRRHAGVLYGKNIHQLAKLARRIPRVISRNSKKLTSGKKLTKSQVNDARFRIAGAHAAQAALNSEIERRNINGKELRSTWPGARNFRPVAV